MSMEEKGISKESAEIGRRIMLRYSIIVILLLGLVIGIVASAARTAFVDKDEWNKIAEKSKLGNKIIYPNRGNIYACDGKLMSTSLPRYRVFMDFRSKDDFDGLTFEGKVSEKNKENKKALEYARNNSADSLAFYLARKFGKNPQQVKNTLMNAYRRGEGRLSLHDGRISFTDLKEIETFPFLRAGRFKSGFVIDTFVIRERPFGTLAARTIGRAELKVDSNNVTKGVNGLELQYDSLLCGKPGLKSRHRIGGVTREEVIVPAEDGMDVYTTIDIGIQDIVEKDLLKMLRYTEAESGTVVVMDVKTGEVKAISNMGRTGGAYYESMNHAVADMSEPGSTIKTASIMIALDDGACEPTDTINTGNGSFTYDKRTITDHRAMGRISVEQAIWYSSNIGVAKTILKGYVGKERQFINGLDRVGLTEDLHIEIPGSGHPAIRTPDSKHWSKTDLLTMSYGYSTQIPPIYMLAFYNAIANDGKMVRPHFTRKIVKDGKVIREFSPEVVRESICSDKTLGLIRGMLEGVVEHGTGQRAKSDVVPIAGKTGTARLFERGSYFGNGHQVSFAGYFPADAPKYSIIAVIRKPSSRFPASGGAIAGVIVKDIAENIYSSFTKLDIDDIEPGAEAETPPHVKAGAKKALEKVLDKLDISADDDKANSVWASAGENKDGIVLTARSIHPGLVPNVVGMSAKDAVFLLESAGLRVRISGVGRVRSQSITSGEKAVKGQTIAITLK